MIGLDLITVLQRLTPHFSVKRDTSTNTASYKLALAALHSLKPGEKPNIRLVTRTYSIN